jgi:hypothetical protein
MDSMHGYFVVSAACDARYLISGEFSVIFVTSDQAAGTVTGLRFFAACSFRILLHVVVVVCFPIRSRCKLDAHCEGKTPTLTAGHSGQEEASKQ